MSPYALKRNHVLNLTGRSGRGAERVAAFCWNKIYYIPGSFPHVLTYPQVGT